MLDLLIPYRAVGYLISAPIPGGLDSETKHQAWPRQVPCHRVPEDVEGVRPRGVASLTDVDPSPSRHGHHVALLEVLITSHLIEGCGDKQERVRNGEHRWTSSSNELKVERGMREAR